MCLYPTIIQNPKYKPNKKNGGHVPPVLDERVKLVPIKCGNCIECRKQKAREWQVRLTEDIKTNNNGRFITLTFNTKSLKELNGYINNKAYSKINEIENRTNIDEIHKAKLIQTEINKTEGYGLDNCIATTGVRLFLERWRKKYKKSLRHWLVSELGHQNTEHVHLHGIIWCNDEQLEELENIWQYGYVWKGYIKNDKLVNYVNEKTINYITKYITKIDQLHKFYKSTILTSAGIGKNYTRREDSKRNKFNNSNTNETYLCRNGMKINLPIYWRNKLYTEAEREALWLHKLDRQERYIMGNKISIKNGEEEYFKTLEHYQKINIELGYHDNSKQWERAEYEKQRRILIQQKRIGD